MDSLTSKLEHININRSICNLCRKKFNKIINEEKALDSTLNKLSRYKAKTLDGSKFNILANANFLSDIKLSKLHNPDGVGLYRSEVPFIISHKMPNEQEQIKIYYHLRYLDIQI